MYERPAVEHRAKITAAMIRAGSGGGRPHDGPAGD